jgi:hypothetical protein
MSQPALLRGTRHIVLNVRNLEASHPCYADLKGFRMTGEWRPLRRRHRLNHGWPFIG